LKRGGFSRLEGFICGDQGVRILRRTVVERRWVYVGKGKGRRLGGGEKRGNDEERANLG